jgi:hypothetical protein
MPASQRSEALPLNAVRISEVSVGDVVAVIGLGLVGHLLAQLARLQEARIAIDMRAELINRFCSPAQSESLKPVAVRDLWLEF